jgi:hypothetical protein
MKKNQTRHTIHHDKPLVKPGQSSFVLEGELFFCHLIPSLPPWTFGKADHTKKKS